MPSRTDRRTGNRLLAILFEDPWRKLASLGLAVLLWFYLDSQLSAPATLELQPVAVDHDAIESNYARDRLTLGIDVERFSAIEIVDAVTGGPIDHILLEMYGPRNRIALLGTNPGFHVVPSVSQVGDGWVAEFAAENVRPADERLDGLIRAMVPERVSVRLAENSETRMLLTPERIRVVPPPEVPDLGTRLLWDRARFEPRNEVTLRGPKGRISDLATSQRPLFEFAPPAPRPDQTELRAVLIARTGDPTVTTSTPPALTVPLRSAAREFTLPAVPVVLFEPEDLRGRFQPRRANEDIRIAATGRLAGRLATLSDEGELRQWAEANCLIVARLPADASGPDVISRPNVIIGPDFQEGRDYKITLPLTIQYELRNP
ncbi:MAG: hypothetical protein IPM29_03470 [Planctomycetes bacterium]|nr:hypothetical protein [Planctomycetota bacterium]